MSKHEDLKIRRTYEQDCIRQNTKDFYKNGSGNGCRLTPYERTRTQVYATGNKWAIENFEATPS